MLFGSTLQQLSVQEDVVFMADSLAPINLPDGSLLIVSAAQGIKWVDSVGDTLAQFSQGAELLDWRLDKNNNLLVATQLLPEQQVVLLSLSPTQHLATELVRVPVRDFTLENICLSRDGENNVSLYLLDERGTAEHWLLLDAAGQPHAKFLRRLPIPPNSKACQVDDAQEALFIVEESVGIWRYSASMEAAPGRKPVDLVAPFGDLAAGAEAIALVPQGLLAVVPKSKELLIYTTEKNAAQLIQRISLAPLKKPEAIHAVYNVGTRVIQLVIFDDAQGKHFTVQIPWSLPSAAQSVVNTALLPTVWVKPEVQTDVMARFGDAADDPAIWVNKKNTRKSLVLGTNKKQGLFVYDMQGREVQHFNSGRLNNVDVRQGVVLGAATVDLAIATRRDDNSLVLYSIDSRSGKVEYIGAIATELEDIYGFCMYQSSTGLYAIANSKDGSFHQIRISAQVNPLQKNKWLWHGELVRRFAVASQPEGCVADDLRQRLFVGEEDVGVWTIGAEPDATDKLQLIAKLGAALVDDVEGLAIYQDEKSPYLIISSQGNNSYLIVDAEAPYQARGVVRVGLDAVKGIDGVSETDGLDVSAFNFGGAFVEGMLVVQDGHKVMPETPQNFKYVAWRDIRKALNLGVSSKLSVPIHQ